MAEIDLASLLPAKALAPFAEEVRSRERRRERRSQVRLRMKLPASVWRLFSYVSGW